ncbi:MAG: hypothetical protein R3A79_29495 [Nannocystaceae bacterium]
MYTPRPHPSTLAWTLALLLPLVTAACSGSEPGDDGSGTTSTAASATASTSAAASASEATTDDPTSAGSSGASSSTSTSGASETSAATTDDPTSAGSSTSDSSGDGDTGFCQERCADDDDCLVDGGDKGFLCQGGRCLKDVKYATLCLDDVLCEVGLATGFVFCNTTAECSGSRVCAAIDGYAYPGVCANTPDEMGACPWMKATHATVDGPDAEVCVAHFSKCDPVKGIETLAYCRIDGVCADDSDCAELGPSTGQFVCGQAGLCACTEDAHCAQVDYAPHCVDGACACASDDECPGIAGADTCVDGSCGCASDRSCPTETSFDGTEITCEPH